MKENKLPIEPEEVSPQPEETIIEYIDDEAENRSRWMLRLSIVGIIVGLTLYIIGVFELAIIAAIVGWLLAVASSIYILLATLHHEKQYKATVQQMQPTCDDPFANLEDAFEIQKSRRVKIYIIGMMLGLLVMVFTPFGMIFALMSLYLLLRIIFLSR